VLPALNDDIAHLDTLFPAARTAGAHFISRRRVTSVPAVRDRFLTSTRRAFSGAGAAGIRGAYARQAGAPREYADALARRIEKCGASM